MVLWKNRVRREGVENDAGREELISVDGKIYQIVS